MAENAIIKKEDIQSRIYTIRNVQIMLDKDLAIFYGVKPIRLREQVKRNIKRFPADFMFQLTEEEVDLMVSQNAIPSKQYLGGYLPFGASLKDMGKKWFAFSKFDKDAFKLLERVEGVISE